MSGRTRRLGFRAPLSGGLRRVADSESFYVRKSLAFLTQYSLALGHRQASFVRRETSYYANDLTSAARVIFSAMASCGMRAYCQGLPPSYVVA